MARATTRPRRHAIALAAVLLTLAAPAAASAATAYFPDMSAGGLGGIDTFTNVAGPVIPTPARAEAIAIAPDGALAYLANTNDNTVTPLELTSGRIRPPIPVGNAPQAIAITPDGATAYVANGNSNNVTPIDLATNTPGTPITGLTVPSGIAITPDGATAYVTTMMANAVTPIDTQTNMAGTPIPVGTFPLGAAVTPDGATLYVTNVLDATVTPIDTATNTPGTPIGVGTGPSAIAMAPDGATAYVVSQNAGVVVPIDTATNTAGTPITVGSLPRQAAITPDGKTVYVTDLATEVTPIDTATGAAGTSIAIGVKPYAVAMSPGQGPVAEFTGTPGRVRTADLDGSATTVAAGGKVARYAWDFGDGDTATSSRPTISHVYAEPGTYNVTLRTTSADGCSTELVFTGQTASCNGSAAAVVTHDVTVDLTDHTLVPAPPAGPGSTPAPLVQSQPATVRQSIESVRVDARCVRVTRGGRAHVGLTVRLARAGRVAVRVDRALHARSLSTCPAHGVSRSEKRGLERLKGAHVESSPAARRLTLDTRLAPGLYRIAIRARIGGGKLTKPANRWVRVLAPRVR